MKNKKRSLWIPTAVRRLILKRKTYLKEQGWVETIKRGYPCDAHGKPLPWMNYAVIHILLERIQKNHIIFEYGSGYSTLFFSRLAKKVTAIEHDEEWLKKLKPMLAENVEIKLKELKNNEDYEKSLSNSKNHYDIIVIDGRRRLKCMQEAVENVNPQCVILLDDSHRSDYKEAFRIAQEHEFKYLRISGLKPGDGGTCETTLFYKIENCLGL